MQQRQVYILLVGLVVVAGGIAAAFLLYQGPPAANGGNEPEIIDKPFDKEHFLETFDVNDDKRVTFEEFDGVYTAWGAEKRFSRGPGQPALDSKQAFAFFDHNGDGAIDNDDVRVALDANWQKFAAAAMEKGLTPRDWKGKFLALNQQQIDTYNKEKGAAARGELPFGGAFFDAKMLNTGRWGIVTKAGGEQVEGFLSEKEGRVWVVTQEARMLVFKPDDVTVKEVPDAPALEYIREVQKIAFDDTAANLKLAKQCAQWGLKREAGALFARVLIFDRANAEALEALQLKLEGDKYVPR